MAEPVTDLMAALRVSLGLSADRTTPCPICAEPMDYDDGEITCSWCREAAEDGYGGDDA